MQRELMGWLEELQHMSPRLVGACTHTLHVTNGAAILCFKGILIIHQLIQ